MPVVTSARPSAVSHRENTGSLRRKVAPLEAEAQRARSELGELQADLGAKRRELDGLDLHWTESMADGWFSAVLGGSWDKACRGSELRDSIESGTHAVSNKQGEVQAADEALSSATAGHLALLRDPKLAALDKAVSRERNMLKATDHLRDHIHDALTSVRAAQTNEIVDVATSNPIIDILSLASTYMANSAVGDVKKAVAEFQKKAAAYGERSPGFDAQHDLIGFDAFLDAFGATGLLDVFGSISAMTRLSDAASDLGKLDEELAPLRQKVSERLGSAQREREAYLTQARR